MLMQVEFESALEHPFFVFDQGWASCYPERTLHCYGLKCHRLQVGDVCICLTPRTKSTKKAENSRKRRWSAPDQFCNDDEEEASASIKRAKDWVSRRYLNVMFLCDVTFQCAGKLSTSKGMEPNSGCTYWALGLQAVYPAVDSLCPIYSYGIIGQQAMQAMCIRSKLLHSV